MAHAPYIQALLNALHEGEEAAGTDAENPYPAGSNTAAHWQRGKDGEST